MAKSFVSPGVFTKEVDVSFLGPGVGTIGAALIGLAPKGPAFVPVTVENFDQYGTFFGDIDDDYLLGYAARAYLKNSATANIVRVLGPSGITVNGSAVDPGYTADSVWTVDALTGGIASAAVMGMIEVTGSGHIVVNDAPGNEFDLRISSSLDPNWTHIAVTASFLTASSNYIKKVISSDPTDFSTNGYYLREVFDYGQALFGTSASFGSSSFALTNFARGFNSGSTPWISSQLFGGSTDYDLFRIHTLGHGEAENGRFKISISNIRPSVAPTVVPYGKFDLELRDFGDTDKSPSRVELFTNLTFDKADPNYIARAVGDKVWTYSVSRSKMVESGDFTNVSNFIRIEMHSASFPEQALPWGFRGLTKPELSISGGLVKGRTISGLVDLPLVADLYDKETQSETFNRYYFGMETQLSGNIKSRLTWLPSMTGSDADFSLTYVSGNSLSTACYNASNPVASRKSPGTTLGHTVLTSDLAKFTVPIAFGFDGFDRRLSNPIDNESQLATISQLGTQALRQAVDIISDPDFIDINLLCIPGIYSSKVVDHAITKVEDRADVFYVSDISGTTPSEVVSTVKGRSLDTNYAAIYYPDVKVWDDVNNISKQIPASIAALGAISYNDRVAYQWFAPAGLNRAGLGRDVIGFDVLSIVDQLTQAERNDLYEERINPIARFPDVPQGVIWGQKTLQIKASALDRINVRRLLIKAKKLIASAVKYLVFEPANPTTMTRFKQLVNPILADIQQKQGLETFKVVMDETTSTPELIDRNRLHGNIFLVPTRTAEFISIDFIISPSGASFEE